MPCSKPILYYADAPGRAHAIRLAFVLGDVAFEDRRFELGEIDGYRHLSLTGVFPVLEVEGKRFSEPLAALDYAARQSGIVPSDPLQALRCGQICHMCDGITPAVIPIIMASNADRPAQVPIATQKILDGLTKIEKSVDTTGFSVGSQISPADLLVYWAIEFVQDNPFGIVIKHTDRLFPNLYAIHQKIQEHPSIKAYHAKTGKD